MNVFEDLIVELKEENLLERTVMDTDRQTRADAVDFDFTDDPDAIYGFPEDDESQESLDPEGHEVANEAADTINVDEPLPEQEKVPAKQPDSKDFYKKRAVAEVSSLQMVEHVLTGVERDYLKITPKAFEDFRVKKALNTYLQLLGNENSSESVEAEQTLMRETQAWCLALAERDQHIPVARMRQYCENTRPALSSQALLGLARFYRNLPYSEAVRAKFDFIITRLFSKRADFEKRSCLFTSDETVTHINKLYKDWSSLAVYITDDDESEVLLAALSFEELSTEAENISNFDQLIACDFFGRLRLFKENISEVFYAPNVTAAAIECNVRVGNAFVKLVERELMTLDARTIRMKHGNLNDSEVSDAAARTLNLVELLRKRSEEIDSIEFDADDEETHNRDERISETEPTQTVVVKSVSERIPFVGGLLQNALSVNKWFAVISTILIAASIGLYIWTDFLAVESVSGAGVQTIGIENTFMKDHVKSAKMSGENFYALLEPSWDTLPKEKRQEFLQKVYQVALEKGCKQVSLIAKDGKTAGYASATHMDVIMP